MSRDLSGQLLSGRFYVEKKINQGGSGEIYLVEDRACGCLNKKWVLKWIDREKNGEWFEMFKNEVSILETCHHPNMSTIHYYEENDAGFFIVIDYIKGETAAGLLKREGPLSEIRVLSWMMTVCSVLQTLHTTGRQPVIYADLNPANIMITREDTVYLLDYGISREMRLGPSQHVLHDSLGTRGFAAPEQYFNGSGLLDARTDIYGVGATMFNLLTGQLPETTIHPKSVCSQLSVSTDRLVSKCLHDDPNQRFQTVQELMQSIEAVLLYEKRKAFLRKRQILMMLLILTGLSLVSACFSGFVMARENQKNALALELSGDEKAEKEDWPGAQKAYLLALEKVPRSDSIYKKLYDLFLKKGAEDERVEFFKDHIKSRYLKADLALGLAMQAIEKENEAHLVYAERLIQRAFRCGDEIEKELAEALRPLLSQELSKEEKQRVLKNLEDLSENDQRQRTAVLYLLLKLADRLALQNADYDRIAEKLENALTEDADFNEAAALYRLLMIHYYQEAGFQDENRRDYLKKAAHYSQCLSAFWDTCDSETALLAGRIFAEIEAFDQAIDILKNAQKRYPKNRQILIELVQLYLPRDLERAKEYYRQLLELGDEALSENLLNQMNSLRVALEMKQ